MPDFIHIHPDDNVAVALKAILTPTNAEWTPAQLRRAADKSKAESLKNVI